MLNAFCIDSYSGRGGKFQFSAKLLSGALSDTCFGLKPRDVIKRGWFWKVNT